MLKHYNFLLICQQHAFQHFLIQIIIWPAYINCVYILINTHLSNSKIMCCILSFTELVRWYLTNKNCHSVTSDDTSIFITFCLFYLCPIRTLSKLLLLLNLPLMFRFQNFPLFSFPFILCLDMWLIIALPLESCHHLLIWSMKY